MISKKPINPHRIRQITGSFSWIDHRLLSHGYLTAMTSDEILLYFFLVLVGDKNGVSFYSYDNICALLKMDVNRFIAARDQLILKSLIACDNSRFQVLQLPDTQPKSLRPKLNMPESRGNKPLSLAKIFEQMAGEP